MPTIVALLRAVNVGGRKLSMAELRELFESLGYADVRTYIQSGNLLFTATRSPKPAVLESAIEGRFGLAVDVMLRSGAELQRVLEHNPFRNTVRMAPRVCVGPVRYVGHDKLRRDIENLKTAMVAAGADEGFMPASAPITALQNDYSQRKRNLSRLTVTPCERNTRQSWTRASSCRSISRCW